MAIDAEKLYAAHQLWIRHNELLQYVSHLLVHICGRAHLESTVLDKISVPYSELSITT